MGGANTVAGGLWFAAFETLFAGWQTAGHYLALLLTYVVTILTGFVLYRRLVYRVHGRWLRDLGGFATVYVGAFALNVVMYSMLLHLVGVPSLPAQLINIAVISGITYLAHGRFSFRR